MKLLLHPPVDDERLAKIRRAAGEMDVVNARDEAEALAAVADADAMFGKITPLLLASARRLRWVQTPTASLEHYVFPELIAHPLVLTNMRGIFSDVIADQVLGYILCFARNLHTYVRQQLEARWAPVGGEAARVGFLTGPGVAGAIDHAHLALRGRTVGIVGLGGIGAEIARRAGAFGMRAIAVDPQPRDVPGAVSECRATNELPWLLGRSDFVVVAAPHTPETAGLFRRAQFQTMKRTAYFINIGRGAIVDLADLDAALGAREIAGAALDVYSTEPLPPDHPLWRRENVILTPHVAGYAPVVARRHLAVLLSNIRRFRRGEPLRNIADKARWF